MRFNDQGIFYEVVTNLSRLSDYQRELFSGSNQRIYTHGIRLKYPVYNSDGKGRAVAAIAAIRFVFFFRGINLGANNI